PEQELGMTELARRAGVPLSTIQREVTRLVRSGILRDRVVGRNHLLSANTDSRLARPLTDLLAVTYGPVAVLDEELGAADGVDLLLTYGPWAAGSAGGPGPPPGTWTSWWSGRRPEPRSTMPRSAPARALASRSTRSSARHGAGRRRATRSSSRS